MIHFEVNSLNAPVEFTQPLEKVNTDFRAKVALAHAQSHKLPLGSAEAQQSLSVETFNIISVQH